MNSNPRQPLEIAPAERVTLDQLKHRAEEVTDLALSETKRVARDVAQTDSGKVVMIAVAAVIVTASLAYYLGTRAVRRAAVGDRLG